MLNIPNTKLLNRGILIFGNSAASIGIEVVKELAKRYNAKTYTYLHEIESMGAEIKKGFYEIYNLPPEQRKYSIIHLNENRLLDQKNLILPLIAEARPLKLIFIVEISNVSIINKEIFGALFGNIPNYLLANVSQKDVSVLNKYVNNTVPVDELNKRLLSIIEGDGFTRQTIEL